MTQRHRERAIPGVEQRHVLLISCAHLRRTNMNSAKPPPPPPRPPASPPPPPPPLPAPKAAGPPRAPPPPPPGAGAPAPAAVSVRAPAAEGPASMAPAAPPAPAPPVMAVPGKETRLRVSVKLSVRDPNLLIARPLGAGEPPPPGTREALLILVEPAANPATTPDGGSTP